MPSATSKWGSLLREAKKVATSWGRQQEVDAVTEREVIFKERRDASQVEQWAVNKLVHYNEWANMASPQLLVGS